MQPVFRYPANMTFKEIELEKVELAEESFRITENFHSESLLESLREVGQLNPAILLERSTHFAVICGFRRVHALKILGGRKILARIFPEENGDPVKLFHLALWDNLAHRQFDPLEKARALFKLKNDFKISEDILVGRYLPMLGLPAHESVLNAYLLISEAHRDLRACLADSRLTIPSIETIAQMPEEVQRRIASLMGAIRLSASMQRKFLDVLIELAAIEGAHPGKVLDDPEAMSIAGNARLSSFQKGEKLYQFLYRKRNPRLSQAIEQFNECKKMLGLPGSITIAPDPFFENPGVRVEFQALNAEHFRKTVSVLDKAAQTQTLDELFQI